MKEFAGSINKKTIESFPDSVSDKHNPLSSTSLGMMTDVQIFEDDEASWPEDIQDLVQDIKKEEDFMPSLLKDACNALRIDVIGGISYLGRGAFGRVFRVMRGMNIFALKIVETHSIEILHKEAEALQHASHTGLTIHCIGEVKEIPNGAALLLSPVGKPLPPPRTEREVASLFNLLYQLHKNNIVHGDPRVSNMILAEEKPIWIDLREARQVNSTLRSWDAEILTRSVLRIGSKALLHEELDESIKVYGEKSNEENLAHIIKMVWERMN
jgi:tRNA A-37 threonylcarbamoyl transferase component Bud32